MPVNRFFPTQWCVNQMQQGDGNNLSEQVLFKNNGVKVIVFDGYPATFWVVNNIGYTFC